MIINRQIISIPPFISTSWSQVKALYMQEGALLIHLNDGTLIKIPQLPPSTLEKVFQSHAEFLEEQGNRASANAEKAQKNDASQTTIELPFAFGFSGLEAFSGALHHSSEHAQAPDLPKEVLQKIGSIARLFAPDDVQQMPKPEPHCNCVHCQIMRAIGQGVKEERDSEQLCSIYLGLEDVAQEGEEDELSKWHIQASADKLFTVTNKKDPEEFYKVYIGEPVGCTCGEHGCVHLIAVLRS